MLGQKYLQLCHSAAIRVYKIQAHVCLRIVDAYHLPE